jgi:CcmD family protein
MNYLFAAYAVFWGLTFGYVFTISSRQKRLEKEIDILSRSLTKDQA